MSQSKATTSASHSESDPKPELAAHGGLTGTAAVVTPGAGVGTIPRGSSLDRIRFILIGAVLGIAWAASLRAFMMVLAGPESTFTFAGTFGIIIATGMAVGALFGLAEYQHRLGHQYPVLVATPLLLGIVALAATGDGTTQFGLAVSAMIGGFALSGRGPIWARIVAGVIALAEIAVPFLAPKPLPNLSVTTPYGLWFATLASSLGLVLTFASAIPMRRPRVSRDVAGQE
jgi:hypothetical protein